MQQNKLIEIENLKTYFYTDAGLVKAVDDVSFDIMKGETLGVVGESGCGKSVTAMSVMQLIPDPPGKIAGGRILYHCDTSVIDLVSLDKRAIRKYRGNHIGMIFQEPMTSLNPVYTVGNQIMEVVTLHLGKDWKDARNLAIDILDKVGIPSPDVRIDEYPHQLSGGMKQRVMIAMSLVCNPSLLIADEPTTALDVTIQAQILDLLRNLQDEFGMSIMMITHDLGVVAETAHRVVVMYAGKVVERGLCLEVFGNPKHPYTIGLFNSIPKLDDSQNALQPIRGTVPNPLEFPQGCKFHPRCSMCFEKCRTHEPPLTVLNDERAIRCWLVGED